MVSLNDAILQLEYDFFSSLNNLTLEIQTSIAYSANIIRLLFYLLREIHNLATSLFLSFIPLS